MQRPTRCALSFPPTLLASILLLAAAPALAQPGASWTETGIVDIFVYPGGSAVRVGREAANVLESDAIDEIQIGDSWATRSRARSRSGASAAPRPRATSATSPFLSATST
jgi:hypothetical protein